MTGFCMVPLEEVCLVVNSGGTPSRKEPSFWNGGTIPWIKTGELNDWKVKSISEHITEAGLKGSAAKLYDTGTILIAMYGDGRTITTMGLVDRPSATNQACCGIVADPRKCVPLYLFYALKARRSELLNLVVAGAQRNLSVGTIRKFPIPMPDMDTQHRIASILGAYDDLIEVNRRRVAVLEEMARGLFEEWFVRFCFPDHESVPLVDTPEGPLPQGWSFEELGQLIDLPYGKALKATDRVPGNIPVIGSSGVVGTHVEAYSRGPGIVLGRKGNVGSVIWSPTDFWPIDTVFFVRSDWPQMFLLQLLHRVPFQNTDAAVPGLNRTAALRKKVTVPPLSLAEAYEHAARPMRDLVDQLQSAIERLAASRDLLLPRLMSGQLSIEAAERDLELAA